MMSDFASEVAIYPQNPQKTKSPRMGISIAKQDRSEISSPYYNRKSGSPSKNMTSGGSRGRGLLCLAPQLVINSTTFDCYYLELDL